VSAQSDVVVPSIDVSQGNGPSRPRPVQQDYELQPKELEMGQQGQIRSIVSANISFLRHKSEILLGRTSELRSPSTPG
jgi:hypothetical protein